MINRAVTSTLANLSRTIPIDKSHCFTQRFSPTGFILKCVRFQLLSPNRSRLAFRLKPIRSVQSYDEISPFPLEEYRFYYAVNRTFLGCSVRVK